MGMREKLIELLNNSFDEQYGKRGLLTAQHTADHLIANGVTILVRCKDCIHYVQMPGSVVDYRCSIFCGCYERPYPMEADGFCSYGERREGE